MMSIIDIALDESSVNMSDDDDEDDGSSESSPSSDDTLEMIMDQAVDIALNSTHAKSYFLDHKPYRVHHSDLIFKRDLNEKDDYRMG